MDRISRTAAELEALVNALMHAKPEDAPVEALLFDGSGLIEILRCSLFEMHERRRQIAGTTGGTGAGAADQLLAGGPCVGAVTRGARAGSHEPIAGRLTVLDRP